MEAGLSVPCSYDVPNVCLVFGGLVFPVVFFELYIEVGLHQVPPPGVQSVRYFIQRVAQQRRKNLPSSVKQKVWFSICHSLLWSWVKLQLGSSGIGLARNRRIEHSYYASFEGVAQRWGVLTFL